MSHRTTDSSNKHYANPTLFAQRTYWTIQSKLLKNGDRTTEAGWFWKKIYPTIYDKAAILLINIVKKHPFANANKRTGFMSAHVFLKVNGYELNADQESSEQLTVKVATFIGDFEVLKSEVAHFFKKYAYLKE